MQNICKWIVTMIYLMRRVQVLPVLHLMEKIYSFAVHMQLPYLYSVGTWPSVHGGGKQKCSQLHGILGADQQIQHMKASSRSRIKPRSQNCNPEFTPISYHLWSKSHSRLILGL